MGLSFESFHEAFFELIDVNQDLNIECDGFTFIEGPIWNKTSQCLTFNDIPESKTYRYSKEHGVELLREDTHKANGNAYDLDGNMVSHYQGKELNSPNDVVVKSNGVIYFTDPRFGRNPSHVGLARPQDLDFQGVFSYHPESKELKLLADDFENPNGLCFGGEEKYLLVNDSPRKHIRKFKVEEDGSLSGGEIFAETVGDEIGLPDGMKVDSQDHVFCCAQGGIHIFDKDGTYLGVIKIPEKAGNCAFGGENMDTLSVAASTTMYSFKIKGCAR